MGVAEVMQPPFLCLRVSLRHHVFMDTASTVTVHEAARLIGVSADALYDAIRAGASPVPVIRVGRRILIVKAALDRLLSGQEASS